MISNRLRAANLESLERQFFDERAQRGARYLQEASPSQIALTLESHLLREPNERALARRDEVDCLLRFYSILELATACGVLADLPPSLVEDASAHLREPAMQRYYKYYYPLLLPQAFASRLGGGCLAYGEVDDGVLQQFVVIDSLRRTPEVEHFLWFLDDGFTDGYGLPDLFATVKSSRSLLRSMTRAPENCTIVDNAVRGFSDFLSFCRELRSFLDRVRNPLLRSAFWHFHGYWFNLVGGQVLGVLTAGIETLRAHLANLNPRHGSLAHDREGVSAALSMDSAIRDLQHLTSSIYRFELESHLYSKRD